MNDNIIDIGNKSGVSEAELISVSGSLINSIALASGSAVYTASGVASQLDQILSGMLQTSIYNTSGNIISITNTNLNNASGLFLKKDGTTALTSNWNAGSSKKISIGSLEILGSSNGSITLTAPISSSSGTYIWPNDTGTNNFVLTTNGAGILSWSNKTGGTSGTINSINGNNDAAQTINGSNSISVTDVTSTHTIKLISASTPGASGYLSFWRDANSINATSGIFLNESLNRLGIGNQTPISILDVSGTITASGGNSSIWNSWPSGSGTLNTTISNVSGALKAQIWSSGSIVTAIANASGAAVTTTNTNTTNVSGALYNQIWSSGSIVLAIANASGASVLNASGIAVSLDNAVSGSLITYTNNISGALSNQIWSSGSIVTAIANASGAAVINASGGAVSVSNTNLYNASGVLNTKIDNVSGSLNSIIWSSGSIVTYIDNTSGTLNNKIWSSGSIVTAIANASGAAVTTANTNTTNVSGALKAQIWASGSIVTAIANASGAAVITTNTNTANVSGTLNNKIWTSGSIVTAIANASGAAVLTASGAAVTVANTNTTNVSGALYAQIWSSGSIVTAIANASGAAVLTASGAAVSVSNTNLYNASGLFLKKDGSTNITSNWNIDGSGTMYIDKINQRIGIGTTSPLWSFHMQGLYKSNPWAGLIFHALDDITDTNMISGIDGKGLQIGGIHNGTSYETARINLDTTAYISTGDGGSSPTQRLTVDALGRVGIGVSNPNSILSVQTQGTAGTATEFLRLTNVTTATIGNSSTIGFILNKTGGYQEYFGDIQVIANAITDGSKQSTLMFHGWDNNGLGSDSWASRLTIVGSKIGVGTDTPAAKLDVRGNAYFGDDSVSAAKGYTYIKANTLNFFSESNSDQVGWINYCGYNQGFVQYRDLCVGDGKGNSILYVDGSLAKVGVGTATPTTTLDVLFAGAGDTIIRAGSSSSHGAWMITDSSVIAYGGYFAYFNNTPKWLIGANGNSLNDINFYTYPSTLPINRMMIRQDGNVGIGDTAPSEKLSVAGAALIGDSANVVAQNSVCFVNKYIGTCPDAPTDPTFILLCKTNTVTGTFDTTGFDGKIFFYRGSRSTYNAEGEIDISAINAYSDYQAQRFLVHGAIPAQLVTTYVGGIQYLAISCGRISSQDIYITGRAWSTPTIVGGSSTGSTVFFRQPAITTGIGSYIGINTNTPIYPVSMAIPYTKTDTNGENAVFISSGEPTDAAGLAVSIKGGVAQSSRKILMQTSEKGSTAANGGILALQYAAGNVSIGTETASSLLTLQASSNDSQGGIRLLGYTHPTDVSYWGEDALVLKYNGVNRTVLSNTGDSYIQGGSFGIGTSTPTAPLSVVGIIDSRYAVNSDVGIQLATNIAATYVSSVKYGAGSYVPLVLQTSGVDRVTIDTTGNVNIGTSINTYNDKLQVLGSVRFSTSNFVASSVGITLSLYPVGSSYYAMNVYNNGGLISAPLALQADSGGNVGIGIVTPKSKLHVAGDTTLGSGGKLYFSDNPTLPSTDDVRMYKSGSNFIIEMYDGSYWREVTHFNR